MYKRLRKHRWALSSGKSWQLTDWLQADQQVVAPALGAPGCQSHLANGKPRKLNPNTAAKASPAHRSNWDFAMHVILFLYLKGLTQRRNNVPASGSTEFSNSVLASQNTTQRNTTK